MNQRHRPSKPLVAPVALALVLACVAAARAQIPCTGVDTQCVVNPVCQADGSCAGTLLSNTTTCDDGNPCTLNDHCNNGICTGTNAPNTTTCDDQNVCTAADHCGNGVCLGTTDAAKLNQPCDLGLPANGCFQGATCSQPAGFPYALCLPSFNCTAPDKCTTSICNLFTGQCTTAPNACGDTCTSATCRLSDGACVNPTPKTGNACNDLNLCTGPDTCQAGVCVGAPLAGGPTRTPTKTVTSGGATPTSTPTLGATATRTATAGGATPSATAGTSACFGDCDGSGTITAADVAKIRSTMNLCGPCPGNVPGGVATGCAAVPNGCVAADFNHDGCLRASELTRFLDNVLDNPDACQAMPAASVAKRAAGVLQSTTSAFLVVPRVVGALLGPATNIGGGGGGAMTIFDEAFNCSTSGGGSLRCDQDFMATPPFFTPPLYTVTLNACKATTSSGRTVTLNGVVTAMGTGADLCGNLPTPVQLSTQSLTVEEVGSAGRLSASFTNFAATVNLSGSDPVCAYGEIDMLITGDLSVETKNGVGTTLTSTQAQFGIGSSIALTVLQYGAECLPVQYQMAVDGEIALVSNGHALSGSYDQYTLTTDATAGDNTVDVDGSLTSDCLGAPLTFLSENSMVIDAGSPCPHQGDVALEFEPPGDLLFDSVHYGAGGVGIDEGDDGSIDDTFTSCLDAALYACPVP